MLIICLASVFTGCGDTKKNDEVKLLTEKFIDAILADDPDTAYSLMVSGINRAEFDAFFVQIKEIFDGVKTYELAQTGWNASINNGISSYKVTFKMTTDIGADYQVETTITENYENIFYIHITPMATGSSPANLFLIPFNIGALIFSAAAIGFVIWMIVDCAKRKIGKKVLWIIIILLGVSITLTIGNGFNIKWMIGLAIAFSSVSLSGGAVSFRLALPVGAIVYFILRKKLTKKAESQQITPENSIEVVSIDGADTTTAPEACTAETVENEEKNDAT